MTSSVNERGGLLPWKPPGQAGEGTEEGDRRHGHHGGSPPAAPVLDLPEMSPGAGRGRAGGAVGGAPGLQRSQGLQALEAVLTRGSAATWCCTRRAWTAPSSPSNQA